MKVSAPGKILLTGAYAVLEGAPALVMAIDRAAIADSAVVDPAPSVEVRAAFADAPAPRVDVSALYDGETKLGLGSSAASLVAALGVRAAARGEDLAAKDVRARLFREAYEAHAKGQGGGSGVDIAAATYGGTLHYQRGPLAQRGQRDERDQSGPSEGFEPRARPIELPEDLHRIVFWSGRPARTSELLAKVRALKANRPDDYARGMDRLSSAARRCAAAAEARDLDPFIRGVAAYADALGPFGDAAGAPIFPDEWRALARGAREEAAGGSGGICFPSGAGGGDVFVYLGHGPPAASWLTRMAAAGFRTLALDEDRFGVRVLS